MSTLKVHFLLLLFISLPLIAWTETADAPIYEIEIDSEKEITLIGGSFQYYKFKVGQIPSDYDLSILARPFGDNDPDIFLSTKQKYPNSKENSEYYSTTIGYSSITIPNSKIVPNSDYYIGLACASIVCYFNLTVDLARDYYFREFQDELTIDFVHRQSLILRIPIPSSPDATHILFSAEMENIQDVDRGLEMFVNAPKKDDSLPSSASSDIKATVAWGDGKAAYVYKGSPFFCTGCNYTVSLEAPLKSKVTFRRTIYGEDIDSTLGAYRDDAVEENKTVTYAVNITAMDDKNPIILIEILPYYGVPFVYAHLGSKPAKLDDYQYSAKQVGLEMLQINVTKKPANGLLYVTVFGKSRSTYSIAYYQDSEVSDVLELGEPESGQIVGQEVNNYIVVAEGSRDMKMKFSLHPDQGKVDLFVKSCDDKNSCKFSFEEVQKVLKGIIKTSKKRPILQVSNATEGDEEIMFEMDGSTCASGNGGVPRCYFAVGVYGSEQAKTAKYVVKATRNGISQALRTNQPVREHLILDQYQYYHFSLPNAEGVIAVNFIVTKISGDVSVYISRNSKNPDENNQDEVMYFNDVYSYFSMDNAVLNGTYYIAVKAHTSATFSIVPYLIFDISSDNIEGQKLTTLSEGIPQKMVVDGNKPAYFKFEAFYPKAENQDIEIFLNEIQGNFELCVNNNGQFPEQGNCQFQTNSTYLSIKPDQDGYLGVGTHFVGVFPRNISSGNPGNSSSAKAQSFSITWAAHRSFKTLQYGTPFERYVANNRIVYLRFEVHQDEDKEIIIHKSQSGNARVELYLANKEVNLGEKVADFKYNLTTKGTTNSSLYLKEEDIENLCLYTGSGMITKCYLYLAVATDSPDNIQFTLTITKDLDNLKLPESIKTSYSFPTASNHPLHLYYYPHFIGDVTIISSAQGKKLVLYANVIDAQDYSSEKKWKFPTKSSYDLVAKEPATLFEESRLFIEASSFLTCGGSEKFRCGVALTLYYENEANSSPYDYFSIMATQDITPIVPGKAVHASVKEDAYRYFRLHVSQEKATLLISMNLLSGLYAQMFISQGRDQRPTPLTAQFYFYSSEGMIQIAPEETLTGITAGDWVIGVYSPTECNFVLNVIYEKTKMIDITPGLPLNMDIDKDPIYFVYSRALDSSVLKMTKQRGSGVISLKKYSKEEIFANSLPTKTEGTIYKFDTVQKMIDMNQKSLSCSDCLIVIAIFAETPLKVSLVLKSDPEDWIFLPNNMVFTDYVENKIINKYEYSTSTDEKLDVNMVVFSGQPKIYISHNPTVNETHKLWSYDKKSPNNLIRLQLNNSQYEGKLLAPIWDGYENISSDANTYYISVISPIPSNYTIALSVSNSNKFLFEGYQEFGFLNPGEFLNYTCFVSELYKKTNTTARFKLQLILHRDTVYDIMHESFAKPNITLLERYIPENKSLPERTRVVPVLREDISERSYGEQNYILNLQYMVATENLRIIVNNSNSKTHLNYSIVTKTYEPIKLNMNNLFGSRLAINEKDIYELHPGNTGLLVAEIHECAGKVKVQFSNTPNLGGIISQDSSMLSSSLGAHISLASLEVKEAAPIYVIVTAVDGIMDNDLIPDYDAIYKIKVDLYPLSNFLPFMKLAPGNDGMLDWDIKSGGNVKIGFTQVKNLDTLGKGIKNAQYGNLNIEYVYDFFMTRNAETANFLSRCDMVPQKGGVLKNLDTYSQKKTFNEKSVSKGSENSDYRSIEFKPDFSYDDAFVTMRVTAIGVDKEGNHVWNYPIIYRPTEVRNVRGASNFIVFILGACLVMLTLAVIGVMYYYSKFQRVKQKLNYEMQDLRNLGTTVESFETVSTGTRKGGYAGLIEEEA